MTDKNKKIITILKTHKLYTTYRAILNVYLNNIDKYGKIHYPTLFKYIKDENIEALIKYLEHLKKRTPITDKQRDNFIKYYLYKTKCKI